jgi:hypothetical protein
VRGSVPLSRPANHCLNRSGHSPSARRCFRKSGCRRSCTNPSTYLRRQTHFLFSVFSVCSVGTILFAAFRVPSRLSRATLVFEHRTSNRLASCFAPANVSPIACPPFPNPPTPPASATSAVSTNSPPLARPCERVPLTTGLHAATLRFFFLRDEHDRNPRAVARTHCGEPREVPLTIGCYRLRLAPVGRGATIGPISGSDLPPKPRSHRFVVGRRE